MVTEHVDAVETGGNRALGLHWCDSMNDTW